jgi:N-glycosylase/DNA lyase
MRIHLRSSEPFSLDLTLCCGQTFRWEKCHDWWYGAVGNHVFRIRQIHNILEFENVKAEFVREYFRLQDDLPKMLSRINKDNHIRAAVERLKGLRVLRQDPWECLLSYTCATFKNIPAIKRMLDNLSEEFGEEVCFDGRSFYTFPTPEKLAEAKVKELENCGLGYRAKYVSKTSRLIEKRSFDFEHLKKGTCEEARKELLDFAGVGSKVADCVLLFSLEKLQVFPVDVWMKRVILRHYPMHFSQEFITKISNHRSLSPSEYESLSSFGSNYFGEYAGYAQEYLYHYERMKR